MARSQLIATSASQVQAVFPASASQVAGITDAHQHTKANFFAYLVETAFRHVGLAGLELLISSDLPDLASQSAGITDVSHCTQTVEGF